MDGRVLRGERNRAAVIEAALDLTVQNGAFPTAQMIAEKAGLATRSVFHHFPDMDRLFAAAAEHQGAHHWSLLRPPDPDHDLHSRIAVAVEQRAELFERISPVRRVAVLYEHQWPIVASLLQGSRAGLARHLRRALEPEISDLDRTSIGALVAAGSWESWEVLRRHQGLSAAAATAAVIILLSATVDRALQTT